MNDMNHYDLELNVPWLRDARRIYLSTAPKKLADLEFAIMALQLNPSSTSHERKLRHLLHNLIGSGASYGFPTVSDTARHMSDILRHRREGLSISDTDLLSDLQASLTKLKRIFGDAKA